MKALSISKILIAAATIAIAAAQTAPAPNAAKGASPAPALIPRTAPGTAAPTLQNVNVPADAVVVSVGDEKITRKEFEQFVEALPPQLRAQATGPQKRRFVEQYVEMKALAQEAHKRKLDEKPEVQELLALQRDNILASTLYQNIAENSKPDDAAMRAWYDQHKSEYEEVKARHILIRFKGSPVPAEKDKKELTDEEALAKAKEIRAKLTEANFADVAKTESDDTATGKNGGELGTFTKGRMVPQFEQAAFSLAPGQFSEPVKTQFGYHIIEVESHDTKPYADVKSQIEARLKPELAKKAADGVRQQTAVTINDDYFGK